MKKDLWLDCDTGCDDVFAIILAGHHDDINLIGISTVFGNSNVNNTTLNTLKITSIAGLKHIKVYKGADKPLLSDLN
jgi:uridine nucleosidase